jgi:hypothetical protein
MVLSLLSLVSTLQSALVLPAGMEHVIMHSSSHSPQPARKELELQPEIRSFQNLALEVSFRVLMTIGLRMLHTGTLEYLEQHDA